LAASSSAAGAPGGALAGGEGRDVRVHAGQCLDLTPRGLRVPRGEPLRLGGLGGAGAPGEGATGLGFGAAGVLPGLLVQQPQRSSRHRGPPRQSKLRTPPIS
jgi:hypothetical protein